MHLYLSHRQTAPRKTLIPSFGVATWGTLIRSWGPIAPITGTARTCERGHRLISQSLCCIPDLALPGIMRRKYLFFSRRQWRSWAESRVCSMPCSD